MAGEESAFVPQRTRSATPFRKIDSFSNPVSKSNFRPEPMKDFAPHYASAFLGPGGQPPPLLIIPQRSPDLSKSPTRWGEEPLIKAELLGTSGSRLWLKAYGL